MARDWAAAWSPSSPASSGSLRRAPRHCLTCTCARHSTRAPTSASTRARRPYTWTSTQTCLERCSAPPTETPTSQLPNRPPGHVQERSCGRPSERRVAAACASAPPPQGRTRTAAERPRGIDCSSLHLPISQSPHLEIATLINAIMSTVHLNGCVHTRLTTRPPPPPPWPPPALHRWCCAACWQMRYVSGTESYWNIVHSSQALSSAPALCSQVSPARRLV